MRTQILHLLMSLFQIFGGKQPLTMWLPGFPGGAGVKNLPASAGGTGDVSLISGSERSPGEGYGNPLQLEIPRIEEPGGLQPMGLQRVGHD